MKNLLHTLQNLRWDLWLVVITLGLVLCGVVMIYSASLPWAKSDSLLLNQSKYAVAGIIAMAVLMQVNYRFYQKPLLIYVTLGVIAALLFIALVGPWEINGAHRWIFLGGVSLQPSELAKAALVVFLAWFLTLREEEGRLENFWHTVAPAGMVTAILAGLIVKEPDLGTTLMLGAIFVVMVFAIGLPLRHLLRVLPLMLPVLLYLIMRVGWRWERVLAFWNPEKYAQGKGYQAWQSLIAVGTGGVNGLGLGQSRQKLFYLPEAHSDFIFAVIGEELGLVGAATLVAAFGFFFYRCYRVSRTAPDRFGQLLALGFATAILVQAFFNISVSLSMLPTKGIPLPFISAGGTSLLVTMATVGVMLNISAHCEKSGKAGEQKS